MLANNYYVGGSECQVLPSNYTTSYACKTHEDKAFQSFRDALTICCILPEPLDPFQAVTEFREEFGCEPPPRYFSEWRSCWDEFEITPEMVTAWLTKVNRTGWVKRLGGVQ